MTDYEVQLWYDTCCLCKKQKPNMPKARCQLYHAVCVSKSPSAFDNIKLFKNENGVCKLFDPKGDSNESSSSNRNTPQRKGPANWR